MRNFFVKILMSVFFIFLMVSCGDAGTDTPIDNGTPLKITFVNKTDYDVKELYYKVNELPTFENPGIKVSDKVLNNEDIYDLCPIKDGQYYFTFVRQNGSYDTNLYISSEEPISLNSKSGLIKLELLPFNFYYTVSKNKENECRENNNGK